MNDLPLAYFITWTVYGTFLQGDSRWWTQRKQRKIQPIPKLQQWHRNRLKHDILLLDHNQREIAESEIVRLCGYRDWHLWAASVRSNHVHAVVSANAHSGKQVRDQLKANCTRVLREKYSQFCGRPVWTVGGDWQCINDEGGLNEAISYVTIAQDRKGRDSAVTPT